MKSGKKYSFSDALFSSTLIHNPVLIQAAGLCAIVAVATTLKTAVLLAAAFFPVLIITQFFASCDISAPRHGNNLRYNLRH